MYSSVFNFGSCFIHVIKRQATITPRVIDRVCAYSSTAATKNDEELLSILYPDTKGEPQPLPPKRKKEKYPRKSKVHSSRPEEVTKYRNVKDAVIQCKRPEFNHYKNYHYSKFDTIPLASKGWHHNKSKGDYFKVNVYREKSKRDSVFWHDEHPTFNGLGLDPDIVTALENLGYTQPTYIQADGIPKIFQHLNTLLAGETGCGKTLAYLVPVIQEVLAWRLLAPERKYNSPLALVLTPSRELAQQISDVARQFEEKLLFDSGLILGGHTKRMMTNPTFSSVDLLIATIGAMSKLTTTGIYNVSYVRHLVLDEADTLLDDSFNEKLVYYLRHFPLGYKKPKGIHGFPDLCKLTLVSATMPTSLPAILGNIVQVDSIEKIETKRLHQVMPHVPQLFLRLGQSQKPPQLLQLCKNNAKRKIPTIIFSNRAATCDWVSLFLNENGVKAINLNGDMPVDIRKGKFEEFQNGEVDFLSCTDSASRGLDTIRVKHVINYDFPVYMSDYIHRCGRTGRVGSDDDCFITNFVSGSREVDLVQNIEMSVRKVTLLPNVNANITKIINYKILNRLEKNPE